MTTRDDILVRVRRNQPAPTPLPDVPTFDAGSQATWARFKAAAQRMGGKIAEPPEDDDLRAFVRRLYPDAKVVCSAAPEVAGNRDLDSVGSPTELDDVDVGIVRGAFGVAETGSIWLTDAEFRVNALGFLAQHLMVLLDPTRIVANLHHAYRDRARFDTRYGVLVSGPSATADIEGVLIHGAQGVRTLTIVPLRLP